MHILLKAPSVDITDIDAGSDSDGDMIITSLRNRSMDEEGQNQDIERKHAPWHWWNNVRTMCSTHKRVGLALELTAHLLSAEVMERWFDEPINACYVPSPFFLTNRK